MDPFYEILLYTYKLYYEYRAVNQRIPLARLWRKKIKYVRFGKLFFRYIFYYGTTSTEIIFWAELYLVESNDTLINLSSKHHLFFLK